LTQAQQLPRGPDLLDALATVLLVLPRCSPRQVIAARVLEAQLRARVALEKKTDSDSDGGGSSANGNPTESSAASSSRRSRQTINERLCSNRTSLWLEVLFALLQVVNINTALVLPCYIVVLYKAPPVAGMLLSFAAVICWMKLVSYAHCCNDLRTARRLNEVKLGDLEKPLSQTRANDQLFTGGNDCCTSDPPGGAWQHGRHRWGLGADVVP
jgi:hypothetical protein